MSTAQKVILHIDFDSFFASVEQELNPSLRGKPMGVTATNGRTCIIASSREAKKLGIGTGSRTWEAKKICPEISLVPANFVKYWEISKKFLGICSAYSPYVELFSLDEVFIDITLTSHLFGGSYKMIEEIKKQIKEEIGEYITVSVGLSYNRLLAKLASGLNKPNGFLEIKKEDVDAVFSTAKLTDVCGIGERMSLRLNKIGVYDLLAIRNVPDSLLEEEFGPAYTKVLKNISWGIDDSPVVPYYEPEEIKSVGRNYCLPQNEYNEKKVRQNIYELCEEVALKLRRLGKKARTAGIYLGGAENVGGRKTCGVYIESGKDLYDICMQVVMQKIYPKCFVAGGKSYVRQISVWAGNLVDSKNVQSSLFTEDARQEKLLKVVDSINDRFGDHTIRTGFLLNAAKLTTVPNGYMADKWERRKLESV